MNVGVFCSQYDVAERYVHVAEDLAQRITKSGHVLVWGGADEGLMHVISETAKRSGARIIGVIREAIAHKARKDADEMHVVSNAHEMNLGIINRSDCVVALVGGVGTLNELTEIIRMNKNGESAKRVIFINTDGFYDGFKMQLQRMMEEGFVREDVAASVKFVDTPEEAMRYIEHHD